MKRQTKEKLLKSACCGADVKIVRNGEIYCIQCRECLQETFATLDRMTGNGAMDVAHPRQCGAGSAAFTPEREPGECNHSRQSAGACDQSSVPPSEVTTWQRDAAIVLNRAEELQTSEAAQILGRKAAGVPKKFSAAEIANRTARLRKAQKARAQAQRAMRKEKEA